MHKNRLVTVTEQSEIYLNLITCDFIVGNLVPNQHLTQYVQITRLPHKLPKLPDQMTDVPLYCVT